MLRKASEERLRTALRIKSLAAANALAEFAGTFVFIFIGLCCNMQYTLSGSSSYSYTEVTFGWGIALAVSLCVLSSSSGGHLNPAVSFCLFSLGKISFSTFLFYSVAQLAAGFSAAFAAYFLYFDQFHGFAGQIRSIDGELGTARVFCSFPADHVSLITAVVDQIIGTACLLFFVVALTDSKNGVPKPVQPVLIGLVLAMIGCAFSLNLGYPINPARDFGPRLFAYLVYDSEVFKYRSYYFWIPLICPFIGAPLGGWLYQVLIGLHVREWEEFAKT